MSLFDSSALASAPVRTILNPGKYHCRINKAVQILSNQKQTPGIEFEFEVVIGPIQENNSDPSGRKVFGSIYSSKDPEKRGPFYSRIHALADAVDFDLTAYAGMSSEEFTPLFLGTLLQKELVVTVGNEEYNGKVRETINGFSHL